MNSSYWVNKVLSQNKKTKYRGIDKKRGSFPTEKELVRAIIRERGDSWHKKGKTSLGVLSEFESSVGRADVLFYSLKKNWRDHVLYGQIRPRWLYALRTLPFRKRFTVEDFAFSSGVSNKTAMKALLDYKRLGYCRLSKENGYWIKIRQPAPIVDSIIAIEAKLKDWKRAMSQAYRYRGYADQAWVILDSSYANGAIAATYEFQRLNVGLKVMDKANRIETLVTPRLHPPKSPVHFWEANALIAAAISKHKTP